MFDLDWEKVIFDTGLEMEDLLHQFDRRWVDRLANNFITIMQVWWRAADYMRCNTCSYIDHYTTCNLDPDQSTNRRGRRDCCPRGQWPRCEWWKF